VTLDKDFGELAVLEGRPHSGIVRLVSIAARRQGAACRDVLARFGEELRAGAIVTVEPGRVRIRPPE
jgi:predicted nuclease of predicted toxin-antitoxin system